MAYLLVQHSVEDYDKWKPHFDAHRSVREAAGSKGALLLRNAHDPNHVTVLFEWDNLDHARAFAESDSLREAMQRAGVAGPPDVYFLEEVERQPA